MLFHPLGRAVQQREPPPVRVVVPASCCACFRNQAPPHVRGRIMAASHTIMTQGLVIRSTYRHTERIRVVYTLRNKRARILDRRERHRTREGEIFDNRVWEWWDGYLLLHTYKCCKVDWNAGAILSSARAAPREPPCTLSSKHLQSRRCYAPR